MLIRQLDECDRERAKALLVAHGRIRPVSDGSVLPAYYRVGRRLNAPRVTITSAYTRIEMTRDFPMLISDLADISSLMKRLPDVFYDDRAAVLCGCMEGRDFSRTRAGELDVLLKPYTIGADSPSVSARKLGPNVCWVNSDNAKLVRAVMADEYVPVTLTNAGPVYSEADIRAEWLRNLTASVDNSVNRRAARVVKAEERLIEANSHLGAALLAQRMLTAGGVSYFDQQLAGIARLPNVVSVTPCGRCSILVKTGPTVSDAVVGNGARFAPRYTGTWEIEFAMGKRELKARNVAAPTKGMQCLHHSYQNERENTATYTCLGGYANEFNRALKEYNFVALVANAIEYLRSFSPTDIRGAQNWQFLPDSKTPPDKPHEFKTWMVLVKGVLGDDDD